MSTLTKISKEIADERIFSTVIFGKDALANVLSDILSTLLSNIF